MAFNFSHREHRGRTEGTKKLKVEAWNETLTLSFFVPSVRPLCSLWLKLNASSLGPICGARETFAAFSRLLAGMKRFSRPLLLGIALIGAFGLGHSARTDTSDDRFNLAQFRVALDQLSAGQTQNARLTLESARARVPLADENAMLLAYLQEKSRDAGAARATLERLEQPSPLATTYLGELGAPVEVAADTTPDNPARLGNSDARVTRLEKLIFDLVNRERTDRGLNALNWSDDLADVGREHSAEMRDKKYFAHESPTRDLQDPLDRYVAGTGRTPRLIAENIYRAWGNRSFLNEQDLRVAHKALMDSPGHRANILLGSANSLGVGLIADKTGDIWLTEMFSRP